MLGLSCRQEHSLITPGVLKFCHYCINSNVKIVSNELAIGQSFKQVYSTHYFNQSVLLAGCKFVLVGPSAIAFSL